MKDYTKEELALGGGQRPDKEGIELLHFCLEMLYEDNTKSISNTIVNNLTYEELIGALLVAKEELELVAEDKTFEAENFS